MLPADPHALDFRFASECPRCGQRAGWTGIEHPQRGRRYLELACTNCGLRFDEYDRSWGLELGDGPLPPHQPGRGA